MYMRPGQVVSLGAPPGASATAPWCGGLPVVKQMLSSLGYYRGTPSGPNQWLAQDDAAMNAFSLVEGLSYRSGVVTQTHCARLIERWEGKFTGALKSQMVRVAREEPGGINAARLRCMAKPGYMWDPSTNTCIAPSRTLVGDVPPEMAAAQACVEAGGVWHSDMKQCVFVEDAAARPAGWWDRQSTGVKVAMIGGGVVAAGTILYALAR